MEVLPNGNPVVTYKGKELHSNCAAVYSLDIGAHNLQQCADSVIRVYSEYFWSQEEYDKIEFHLTNGELMRYTDWRDGDRLVAAGNFTTQLHLRGENDSYECFRAYLECVMNYAGTKSLHEESETIPLSELKAGDLLLIPGAPGHVILTVDMAENENGEKCYLFAQGFHIVKILHIRRIPGFMRLNLRKHSMSVHTALHRIISADGRTDSDTYLSVSIFRKITDRAFLIYDIEKMPLHLKWGGIFA